MPEALLAADAPSCLIGETGFSYPISRGTPMQALFIPLVFIWVITTMTAYLCMLQAMVARTLPGLNEDRVPHLLRSAYRCGFAALGCFAIGALLIAVDFMFVQHRLPEVTLEQWGEFAEVAYRMGPYAAIALMPTATCWIWWKRSYGAVLPCELIKL
jgi:hypothetical protein